MNLWKSKKAVALVLTLIMIFSNAAVAMAVPSKVQIGTVPGDGVQQYDYNTVMPGGSNRAAFMDALLTRVETKSLIIKDGEDWWDVDGRDLDAAKELAAATPATTYVPYLANGKATTMNASQLIDDIRDCDYTSQTEVDALWARYQALTAAEAEEKYAATNGKAA